MHTTAHTGLTPHLRITVIAADIAKLRDRLALGVYPDTEAEARALQDALVHLDRAGDALRPYTYEQWSKTCPTGKA